MRGVGINPRAAGWSRPCGRWVRQSLTTTPRESAGEPVADLASQRPLTACDSAAARVVTMTMRCRSPPWLPPRRGRPDGRRRQRAAGQGETDRILSPRPSCARRQHATVTDLSSSVRLLRGAPVKAMRTTGWRWPCRGAGLSSPAGRPHRRDGGDRRQLPRLCGDVVAGSGRTHRGRSGESATWTDD